MRFNYKIGLNSDLGKSIETLFRVYFEHHKNTSIKFFKLNNNIPNNETYEFREVRSLKDVNINNYFERNFTMLWPTNKSNACFDFLTISNQDKKVGFYQVTIETNEIEKIKKTFFDNYGCTNQEDKFLRNYCNLIEQINENDFSIEYYLLHGKQRGHGTWGNHQSHYSVENVSQYKQLSIYKVKCFSIPFLGELNYFNSDLMRTFKNIDD